MSKLPLLVLKLGGSIITEMAASGPELNDKLCKLLAQEIASLKEPKILVHGTGHYGKPPAVKYNYADGGYLPKEHAHIVSRVSSDLEKLNSAFLYFFRDIGISVLPINVSSIFKCVDGVIELYRWEIVSELLIRNITPVISGGFILDSKDGFVICSSDIIASQLAIKLKAKKLIFATNVSGVFRQYGMTNEIYSQLTLSESKLIKNDINNSDVSGGMIAKVKAGFAAVQNKIETYIIDGRISNNIISTVNLKPISGTHLREG